MKRPRPPCCLTLLSHYICISYGIFPHLALDLSCAARDHRCPPPVIVHTSLYPHTPNTQTLFCPYAPVLLLCDAACRTKLTYEFFVIYISRAFGSQILPRYRSFMYRNPGPFSLACISLPSLLFFCFFSRRPSLLSGSHVLHRCM